MSSENSYSLNEFFSDISVHVGFKLKIFFY